MQGTKYCGNYKSVVFESTYLLPHLTKQFLDFSGVMLLPTSEDVVYQRLIKTPRWSNIKNLQRLEAEWIFNCEAVTYNYEASKHSINTYTNTKEAKQELLTLLKL